MGRSTQFIFSNLSNFISCYLITGERRRLKKGVVPSIFTEREQHKTEQDIQIENQKRQRQKRASHRAEKRQLEPNIEHIAQEVEVVSEEPPIKLCKTEDTNSSIGVQCSLLTDRSGSFSIDNFQNNDKAIKYYTGFDDYEQFMVFFHVLGPAAYHLNLQCATIHPKDQLLMTLIKLRQNKDDYEISLFFKVSQPFVSNIITTWINFLYFQLKEINIWPEKEIVEQYMPEDFKRKFPATRVILDATEIPVQKPSDVVLQSATFSTYKHKNTLKTMIGISPNGLVTYISNAYGGCTSDRQIIERSDLCKKDLFNKKDSIMADRGIMVQDLFATKDVHVNTPTMLKGKSQLEPTEVARDRRIASKRIHVERVIGLAKQYKILSSALPLSKLKYGSRIVFICFSLLNFRTSIVGKLA